MGVRWDKSDRNLVNFFHIDWASIRIEALIQRHGRPIESPWEMLQRVGGVLILRDHLMASVEAGQFVIRPGTPIVVGDRWQPRKGGIHHGFFTNPVVMAGGQRPSIYDAANWLWREESRGFVRPCWRFAVGTPV